MSEQAQELGVEVYEGFAGDQVLYDDKDRIIGVATSDQGIDKQGKPKSTFTRGVELRAGQTIFAEGAKGKQSVV